MGDWIGSIIVLMDLLNYCKHCNQQVFHETGWTEDIMSGRLMHEECIQLAGEDNGAIEKMARYDDLTERARVHLEMLGFYEK